MGMLAEKHPDLASWSDGKPPGESDATQSQSQVHTIDGVSIFVLLLQVCIAVVFGVLVETWRGGRKSQESMRTVASSPSL